MKTLYEVLNVDLAQEYTKARKKAVLETLELDAQTEIAAKKAIDDMIIPEDDDRLHWIQKIGNAAGADLLTIGKVQPENMLAMAALSEEDFQECVKVATGSARRWNELTVAAEKELNKDLVPSTMI
jgi:hypothetical protein